MNKRMSAAQLRIENAAIKNRLALLMEYVQQSKPVILSQQSVIAELREQIKAHEESQTDHKRLVRELDVLLNGDGAAEQASLCDIVGQVAQLKRTSLALGSIAAATDDEIDDLFDRGEWPTDKRG